MSAHALPFSVSPHAIERALDMQVEGAEIRRAVENPQDVRTDAARAGCEYRTAGRITIVYNPERALVVTVMWRYESKRRADLNRADYDRKAPTEGHAKHRRHMARRRTRADRQFSRGRANGTDRRAARWAEPDDD